MRHGCRTIQRNHRSRGVDHVHRAGGVHLDPGGISDRIGQNMADGLEIDGADTCTEEVRFPSSIAAVAPGSEKEVALSTLMEEFPIKLKVGE